MAPEYSYKSRWTLLTLFLPATRTTKPSLEPSAKIVETEVDNEVQWSRRGTVESVYVDEKVVGAFCESTEPEQRASTNYNPSFNKPDSSFLAVLSVES